MKKFLTIAAAALLSAAVALPATAQEWPKKQPIKIIVRGTPAGGGTDVLARITAEFLQRRIGQVVVVENKPGAGQAIAIDYVAKSAPDGYTLQILFNDLVVLPAVRNNLPYKFDEMTYLIRPFSVHPILYASPKLEAKSTQEFLDYMKANPGRVRYGTAGVGSLIHLMVAQFDTAVGVKGVHIPYTGVAPVYQDMLAGTIEYTIASPPNPEGVKVLASVGTKRNPAYPNAPTLSELGIKGATIDLWAGFIAPPNMPKPLAERITSELKAIFQDPEAVKRYQEGAKFTPDPNGPAGDEFKRMGIEENRQWKAVVEREKIVVQQ